MAFSPKSETYFQNDQKQELMMQTDEYFQISVNSVVSFVKGDKTNDGLYIY